MTLVPLKFPPGIVRPGTRYDAKGRWYDANLVRWHERAMQPIGGWGGLLFSDAAVSAAISDDGGVQTDETSDANEATADDVVLVPATPQVDDAFYLGWIVPFDGVTINVSTVATDGAVTWEYYDGSSWTALAGVTDGTGAFQNSGENDVSFTEPSDWSATTVNSQGPFFYIRARVTTAGTTMALGEQAWITASTVDLNEPVCGILAWRANDATPELALGTPTKLFQFTAGALADITPSGFTTGNEDASLSEGAYNLGAYGAGVFGTGDTTQETLTETNTWSLDTFGEDLVACAYSDGSLYQWDKSTGGVAAVISGAPTNCLGVVVTPERFLVALGAGGDGRLVQWADQESLTDWTPAANNQAGDFPLGGSGQLMAGRSSRNETLLWTDTDLWTMRYIGGSLIYSFQRVGAACGSISRRSMVVVDGQAFWMGPGSFFVYDGYVKPLPSDVGDYVFSDINRVQASKIAADVRSEFGEVWWFYPSASSTENDRYVVYNYRTGIWNVGQLERTAGVDRGAFQNPIMVDASGQVYQHETGESYEDPTGSTLTPYAVSGPMEIAEGNNVMYVKEIIPDEQTLGDVQMTLRMRYYPTEDATEYGPYSMTEPTPTRAAGREVMIDVDQVRAGWRFGTPRLDVTPGGRR